MDEAIPILIVDENRAMIAMLRCFLARKGIDVRTATGVAEAETLLTRHGFRVVLTDLFWPSNDGLCLVRHMRRAAPHTRVMVMTAFPEDETCQHAIAAGAAVCLAKPFRLQQLWDAVQKVLEVCHIGAQA